MVEHGAAKHSVASRCGCSEKIEVLNELQWKHTRDKLTNRITIEQIEQLDRALELNFESLDTFEHQGKKSNFSTQHKSKKSSNKLLKPSKFINPSKFLK